MTDVPDLDRFHREAIEEARQQIIANRWAAFTDDELGFLRIATSSGFARAMREEIIIELTKRHPLGGWES